MLIDNIDPWKEFNWVGKKIEIGDCILEVFKRTQRCAATNVNPENALGILTYQMKLTLILVT